MNWGVAVVDEAMENVPAIDWEPSTDKVVIVADDKVVFPVTVKVLDRVVAPVTARVDDKVAAPATERVEVKAEAPLTVKEDSKVEGDLDKKVSVLLPPKEAELEAKLVKEPNCPENDLAEAAPEVVRFLEEIKSAVRELTVARGVVRD